jgi:hypothetical protein
MGGFGINWIILYFVQILEKWSVNMLQISILIINLRFETTHTQTLS